MSNKKEKRQAAKATKAAKAAVETVAASPVIPDATAVAEAAANPAVVEAVKKVRAAKPAKEGALPKLPKLAGSGARAKRIRPVKPCACGCKATTKGEWAPGHDARANGWAIRIEREVIKMSDVPANEQQGAALMLKRRAEAGATGQSHIKLVKGKDKEAAAAVNE